MLAFKRALVLLILVSMRQMSSFVLVGVQFTFDILRMSSFTLIEALVAFYIQQMSSMALALTWASRILQRYSLTHQ